MMMKLMLCLVLALAVSCGEDEQTEVERGDSYLEGVITEMVCDGQRAVYQVRLTGLAQVDCAAAEMGSECRHNVPRYINGEVKAEASCISPTGEPAGFRCYEVRRAEDLLPLRAADITLHPAWSNEAGTGEPVPGYSLYCPAPAL